MNSYKIMQEQVLRAPYNYSIKKLNISSIPLSEGLENDILQVISMYPKFCVKLYINDPWDSCE